MATKSFKFMWLAAIVVLVVLVGICAFAYLMGDVHGVEAMKVERITPDQAASAMATDDFFGSYRERALVVTGQVDAVSQSNGLYKVTFATTSPYHAFCQMAPGSAEPIVGQTVTAVTVGGPAEREPNGVLMVDCTAL